ncbi:MAG: hypothetical protein JNJ58_11160 [Chitinophagaceae bacterium]|nr:hypothetical protein [Chitinophagaceae bacterium]
MQKSKPLIGTIITTDLPQVHSQLSLLGYDFLFIDLEHGHVSDSCIRTLIQTRSVSCKMFIRISEINERCIKHALDLGCDGLIAPRVENREEIQTLIEYSYYPPLGKRSVGFCAANQYGLRFKEYTDHFRPTLLPQIESVKGLEILPELMASPEINGIFVGPYDLSMSLGVPSQFESEIFQKAYESIRTSCRTHQKEFCTFSSNVQHAQNEMHKGADRIALGVDTNLLLTVYDNLLKSMVNE